MGTQHTPVLAAEAASSVMLCREIIAAALRAQCSSGWAQCAALGPSAAIFMCYGAARRGRGGGTADPVQPHSCRKPCCPLCSAPFPLVASPSCFIPIIFPPCSHRVVYVALVPAGPAQPCCFLSPPCCSEGRCCQTRIRRVPATQGRAVPEGTFGAVGCGGCAGVSHTPWVNLRTRVPTGPPCHVPILSWSPWLGASHTPLQPGSPLRDLAALHCQHALGSAPLPALRSRPPQHCCALIRTAGARSQPWEQCGWLCSPSPVQHRGSRVPGMGCLILHAEHAALPHCLGAVCWLPAWPWMPHCVAGCCPQGGTQEEEILQPGFIPIMCEHFLPPLCFLLSWVSRCFS